MAVYWHPFLIEMLRWEYGSRVDVRDEVPLGEMPPRLDILLLLPHSGAPRDLPFPFSHLGERTLAEVKGPDEGAGQDALVRLLTKTLAFQAREQAWCRPDLTLWLIASSFAADLSLPDGAEAVGAEDVGPGVVRATVDKFPLYLIDLNALPVTPATLPLAMVSKGQQERVLVEYLVEHAPEHSWYIEKLPLLHPETLKEVLVERQMAPEEIGLDMEALARLIGPATVAKAMTPDEMEAFVRLVGPEVWAKVMTSDEMEEFIRAAGPDRVREVLDRIGGDPNERHPHSGRAGH